MTKKYMKKIQLKKNHLGANQRHLDLKDLENNVFDHKGWSRRVLATSVFGIVLMFADPAYCITFGTIFNNGANTIKQGESLLEVVSLASAAVLAIGALFKMYQRQNNPQSVKGSTILVMILVAGGLAYVTKVLESSTGTLFGEGGAQRGARIRLR